MDSQRRHGARGVKSLPFALVLSLMLSSAWAVPPKLHFDIPAGRLVVTIMAFAKQAQIDTAYASDLLPSSDIATRAVVGDFDVAQALTLMLEGTGVTFQFESEKSVLFKFVPSIVPVSRQGGEGRDLPSGSSNTRMAAGESEPPAVPEVVITGSYLHGVLDIMSPLLFVM
jgi:outer-membrane receptor for ferric coprogen and ferric-rhodotorulic acid